MESKLVRNGIFAATFVDWLFWIATIGAIWLPSANGNGQWLMEADELWGFWYMDKPTTSYNYDTDTFTFNYKLNMTAGVSVTDNLRADIFTSDCSTHVGAAEGVVFETINSNGEHVFQLDYQTVEKVEALFQWTSESTAQADYCLRFSMWTGTESDPTATMVNWIDTLLIIYFLFDGTFSVDILVEKTMGFGGVSRVYKEEEFKAIGYLCDPVTREPLVFDAINQGTVIHTCVELDQVAIDQGLVIDFFPFFYWTRDYGDYNVTQEVYNYGTVVDPLSIDHCHTDGVELTHCHFDSLLAANFFKSPGQVIGVGMLFMTFGTPSRRLQTRDLQDDSSLWAKEGGFSMSVPITIYDGETYQRRTAGGIAVHKSIVTNVANVLVALGIWILLEWR